MNSRSDTHIRMYWMLIMMVGHARAPSWIQCLRLRDTLARLSIYLLSESSPIFSALVKPLLTPKTISESLIVMLLDWAEPWAWARQLRDWVRFLKGIVASLDDECKIVAEETIREWQQRRRGAPYEGGSAVTNDTAMSIPLGQGEWEEPLGLPICVACHGVSLYPPIIGAELR